MKLGNFNGGYKILDFVKAVAYATGSASTETISGLYNRVKEALEDKSKPLVLHDLIIDVSGSQTLIGDTFIDRANAKVDASKVVFFIGVGSNNVKITVTSAGALNADVYEYAGGAGGVSDLDDLSDVALDNPANGQVLKYNSTTEKWENANGGGGVSDLDDLTDVTLNNPTNGQVLKYNTTTHKWENANESGGGGSVDYQIIDPDSATLYEDIQSLDFTKPVFIKVVNGSDTFAYPCVGVLPSSFEYDFIYIREKAVYTLQVYINGGEVSDVYNFKNDSLEDLLHYMHTFISSVSVTIPTGATSGVATITSMSGTTISSIDDMIGNFSANIETDMPYKIRIPVEITDVDANLSGYPAFFEITVHGGSSALAFSDAELYVSPDGTNGGKYRLVPNKTMYYLHESTPDAISFTLYREVIDDVYIVGQEVLTNKRFNGEPVYRKVFSITGANLKTDWSPMPLITDGSVDKLLHADAMVINSGGGNAFTLLPFWHSTNDYLEVTARLAHSDNTVSAFLSVGSSTGAPTTLNIGIEYTKATT